MSEAQHQAAFFAFLAVIESRIPEVRWVFHPANGGMRPATIDSRGRRYSVEGRKLAAQGVKSGVPDLWCCIPSNGYHGWVCELKYGHNRLTPEQANWLQALDDHGWRTLVAYTWTAAAVSLLCYLGHDPTQFGLEEERSHAHNQVFEG